MSGLMNSEVWMVPTELTERERERADKALTVLTER